MKTGIATMSTALISQKAWRSRDPIQGGNGFNAGAEGLQLGSAASAGAQMGFEVSSGGGIQCVIQVTREIFERLRTVHSDHSLQSFSKLLPRSGKLRLDGPKIITRNLSDFLV